MRGGIRGSQWRPWLKMPRTGVIAPFLFMALLGAGLGGTLYKAVNTMDSMVGYKNDRYMYVRPLFAGWTTCNLAQPGSAGIPYGSGGIGSFGYGQGLMPLRYSFRDRKRHASPNSAHGRPPVQAPSISAWPVTPGTLNSSQKAVYQG